MKAQHNTKTFFWIFYATIKSVLIMQTSLAEDQLLLSKIIFFRREIIEERH